MFATDRVSVVTGVVGDSAAEMESVRTPLINAHVLPEHGNHRPAFQIPILRAPWRRAKDVPQQTQPGDDNKAVASAWATPQPTRRLHQPSSFERRLHVLTGSIVDTLFGRGRIIERPTERGKRGSEKASLTSADEQEHAQTIKNPSTYPGGAQDDITENLAPPDSEPHQALRSARANWPFLPTAQMPPQTRTVPLVAGTAAEIFLPDLAVMVRLVAPTGVDVWWSLQGNARLPLAGDMGSGNVSALSEGMILNPDPQKYYYVKGIKSISAISAVNTFVNVQGYVSA